MQLSMPLAHMPERYMLRDSQDYDYEYWDDDDYFDDDDGTVRVKVEGCALGETSVVAFRAWRMNLSALRVITHHIIEGKVKLANLKPFQSSHNLRCLNDSAIQFSCATL